MSLSINDRVELKIDSLAFGGEGVGRFNSLVIFVPFSAPDDQLEVEITEVRKNFARAKIVRILSASPERITPNCAVFGTCGGCQWQHVEYQHQIRAKTQNLKNYLQKHLKIDPSLIENTLPSPKQWRYRNRVQLRMANGQLGYFAPGTHEIINIDDCPVTDEKITTLFSGLRTEYAVSQDVVKIELTLRRDGNHVHKTLNQPHAAEVGFSQVNNHQNVQLKELVQSLVPEETLNFLDLYCGAGNFLLPISQKFMNKPDFRVIGVEINTAAVQLLNQEIVDGGLKNVEVQLMDVTDFLKNQSNKFNNGVALIDPPRVGCSPSVLNALANSNLNKIIYVSCNPTTFARDAAILMQKGWDLRRVYPIDMFPQTYHLELVADFQTR